MHKLCLRPLSEAEETVLSSLYGQSQEELQDSIAQSIGTLEEGEEPAKAWQRWLDSKKAKLYDLICVRGEYCAFIKGQKNARKIDIVAAVSDVLASAFGGLPVFTLATLVVKYSLDELCRCDEGDSN